MSRALPLAAVFAIDCTGIVADMVPCTCGHHVCRASARVYRSTGIHLPLAKQDQFPDLAQFGRVEKPCAGKPVAVASFALASTQSAIIFSMCGRYKLSRRKQLVEEYFDTAVSDEPDWTPRFNIAPTQPVPVIRQNPKEPVRRRQHD